MDETHHSQPSDLASLVTQLWHLEDNLRDARRWLWANATELTAAGVTSVGFTALDRTVRVKIALQCPDRRVWADVTRILMRGAGLPGLTKGHDVCPEVVRQFGAVTVRAWVPTPKVCTPLPGTDPDDWRSAGWDCTGVRVLAGVA